jgi:TolB-like protein
MSNAKQKAIQIDLDRFKLHLNLIDGCELSLHFDTPSRRFYLCVIAFVVSEMKKRGRITSIPMGEHWELLARLNETVAAGAGSSSRENLLSRIYRKWKDGLPDLESAPLFKVLGKRKEYGDGVGKAYPFTDEEKDAWANLFEYKGSFENVRLRFSIDKLGATLNDVDITYGESTNLSEDGAWERFVNDLQRIKEMEPHEIAPIYPNAEDTSEPPKQLGERKWWARWRFAPVIMLIVVMVASLKLWLYLSPEMDPASEEKMAYPLPERPSIAVLPFVNLTGDPSQEYLSDGITENIITVLSEVPQLFVIARNSTFAYKGKPVKVQQVAEDLGVRYVLEGSVARSGDRIRVTAQLIDALNGHHLWTERYDRELKDLFVLQDDLTRRIFIGIGAKLTYGEDFLHGRGPKNIEVWLKLLQATEYLRAFNIDGNNRARIITEECIALEPDFGGNYWVLGSVHMMDYYLGSTRDPAKSLLTAIEYLEKAIALGSDEGKGRVYPQLGNLYAMKKDYEKAIELGEKGIAMVPNGAEAHAWLAMSLNFAGRGEEALPFFEKAIRLNPFPPAFYYLQFGHAYRSTGRFEEAVSMYKKTITLTPNNIFAFMGLAGTYGIMGKDEEAKAAAAEVLRINPKWSLEYFAKTTVYKDKERFIEGLRKAGLK